MSLEQKIQRAIDIIKLAADMSHEYYDKPLIVTYSGGKDSDVLMHLATTSGANVEFENNHTTVDAPETVRHIRSVFGEREREKGITLISIILTIKTETLSVCGLSFHKNECHLLALFDIAAPALKRRAVNIG